MKSRHEPAVLAGVPAVEAVCAAPVISAAAELMRTRTGPVRDVVVDVESQWNRHAGSGSQMTVRVYRT